MVQLLLERADPGKPCGALGLLPGQHAVLQVPSIVGMLCTLRTCRAVTLCAYWLSATQVADLPQLHRKSSVSPSCEI